MTLFVVELDDSDIVEELYAEPLGGNRYLLNEAPLVSELAQYDEVIEAEPQSDGSLKFLRVAHASNYLTSTWWLSRKAAESPALEVLKERIAELGGQWSVAMGGILLIHMPPDVDFDAGS